MIFCIKNFHKNINSSLTAKSIKHFGNYKIYLINVYQNKICRENLDESLFEDIYDFKAKYDFGPGFANPANGYYFTEGINHAFNIFKEESDKLIILDEDHFFTNGATIKELNENEYDYAWAHWASPNPHPNDINAAIMSLRPSKFLNLNIFPIPERMQYVETLLRLELFDKIPNNLIKYKIKNRNYLNYGAEYYGDGCFTNDHNVILQNLKNVGIL